MNLSDDINDPPSEYENLFKIESYDGLYGKITTAKPLRGYHGKWRVTIQVGGELQNLFVFSFYWNSGNAFDCFLCH